MSNSQDPQESPEFIVRMMKPDDIDRCLEIWAQVELTEARQTVASSYAIEPEAFNVAELEGTGQIIGMCAALKCCNGETAFIGFYAVEPKYQHLGIGRELWSRTVERIDSNVNKGLYGVPEMAEKYRKIGFIQEDSISMLVYHTNSDQSKEDLRLSSLWQLDQLGLDQVGLQIFDGHDESLLERLIGFDGLVQGFSRENLLRKYLLGDDIPLTVIVMDLENQIPLGYGIIRKDNTSGGIIGPIYANNPQLCEVILGELISRFELERGKIFTIMPLTSNRDAINILRKIGFVEEHDCSRMFTKFVPKADISKIFYIHSPNFNVF